MYAIYIKFAIYGTSYMHICKSDKLNLYRNLYFLLFYNFNYKSNKVRLLRSKNINKKQKRPNLN